jgi:uncharacterized cupredoxin-like copper-binding protein
MKNLYLSALVLFSLACLAVGVAFAGGGSGAKVKFRLTEMSILPTQARAPAGKVTLIARNQGSIEHELVVVRAPRSGKLRVDRYKAAEAGAVGEIEEFAPGKEGRVTLSLRAGRYLLICNIPGHYQLGMRAELLVGGGG